MSPAAGVVVICAPPPPPHAPPTQGVLQPNTARKMENSPSFAQYCAALCRNTLLGNSYFHFSGCMTCIRHVTSYALCVDKGYTWHDAFLSFPLCFCCCSTSCVYTNTIADNSGFHDVTLGDARRQCDALPTQGVYATTAAVVSMTSRHVAHCITWGVIFGHLGCSYLLLRGRQCCSHHLHPPPNPNPLPQARPSR